MPGLAKHLLGSHRRTVVTPASSVLSAFSCAMKTEQARVRVLQLLPRFRPRPRIPPVRHVGMHIDEPRHTCVLMPIDHLELARNDGAGDQNLLDLAVSHPNGGVGPDFFKGYPQRSATDINSTSKSRAESPTYTRPGVQPQVQFRHKSRPETRPIVKRTNHSGHTLSFTCASE